MREHVIDEVAGKLAHPPAAARRTEAAPPATEADHCGVAAALTLNTEQAVRQDATLEVPLELAPHERRPPAGPVVAGRPRQERR
jgi:hypothetical protein